MKSFISILLSIPVYVVTFSQVPKNIITEHFTNTVCSICASKNPQLNDNLSDNPSVLRISYHPSSPYASCILNQHNVLGNDTRTNAYNIYGGTPRIVIQGDVQSPSVNFSSTSLFDAYQNESTFVTIDVTLDTVSVQDSIKVIVKTTLVVPIPAGGEVYSLYSGIAEDTIFYNAPNGENKHINVFRKALNGNSGTTINLPSTVGDFLVNEFIVEKDSDWNISRVFAYALIQKGSNMEVEQVGSSTPIFENMTLSVEDEKDDTMELVLINNQEELNIKTKKFREYSYYSLYNFYGQLLLSGLHLNNYSSVSISSLPPGGYVLKVEDKSKVTSQKFLKLN